MGAKGAHITVLVVNNAARSAALSYAKYYFTGRKAPCVVDVIILLRKIITCSCKDIKWMLIILSTCSATLRFGKNYFHLRGGFLLTVMLRITWGWGYSPQPSPPAGAIDNEPAAHCNGPWRPSSGTHMPIKSAMKGCFEATVRGYPSDCKTSLKIAKSFTKR